MIGGGCKLGLNVGDQAGDPRSGLLSQAVDVGKQRRTVVCFLAALSLQMLCFQRSWVPGYGPGILYVTNSQYAWGL